MKTLFAILLAGSLAYGSDFCTGFEQGYQAIKGNIVVIPICPVEPVTPINSTPFQEGIKAGMRKAQSNDRSW